MILKNKNNKKKSEQSITDENNNGLMFEAIPDESDNDSSEYEDKDDSDVESSFFATAELNVKEIRDRSTLDDEISRAVTVKSSSKEKSSEDTADENDDDFGIEIFDLNERKSSLSRQPSGKRARRNSPDADKAARSQDSKDAPGKAAAGQSDTKTAKSTTASGQSSKKTASGQSRDKASAKRPPRRDQKKTGSGISLQLVLLILILVIAASAVILLAIWNKGKDASVKEGEVTNNFAVEVNDEMVYLPDSKLEGHADDGKTTILCLGNEPFADDLSETGLAGQIEKLSGAEVINASFPNSQVTCLERKYDPSPETRDDIFNLFYVANSINLNDFTAMETVASFHDDDGRYSNSVETLKNTDFESVDVIAVLYDAADYLNGMSMQNPDDQDDLTTYVNSLSYSFKLIQEKYPWIRIVFLSPYYVNVDNEDSRTNNIGNGTLVNYFQWSFDTCAGNSVSFIDNYYGSVNENNYTEYTTDGRHLNEAGFEKIADHFVYKVIEDNYSEYDVDKLLAAKSGN